MSSTLEENIPTPAALLPGRNHHVQAQDRCQFVDSASRLSVYTAGYTPLTVHRLQGVANRTQTAKQIIFSQMAGLGLAAPLRG